ncbi:MAG: hypothetical protein JWQ04_647 [Pedosphaera sp.]|nr:hypothetical protein [Pedosphaera sp.]
MKKKISQKRTKGTKKASAELEAATQALQDALVCDLEALRVFKRAAIRAGFLPAKGVK